MNADGTPSSTASLQQRTTPDDGVLGDQGTTGWAMQAEQLAAPGETLTVTRVAHGGSPTLLHGYASCLVRADGRDF
ncbi:hypothetical protein [Geodermatophilus maliterrae]|uniref:Uncharacterized protein n=1 Tax=Geodermatophilus maliterrae TaxID=3162531 RepID=A0ABV3XIL1_9ACTN